MKSTTLLVIVAIVAALGTVGIISAISSATNANAAGCKQETEGFFCHGCASTSKAFFNSDFKCRHIP